MLSQPVSLMALMVEIVVLDLKEYLAFAAQLKILQSHCYYYRNYCCHY